MSDSHPLDWNTASEVPGGKPWISLIAGGLVLHAVGGVLIGVGVSSGTSPDGTSQVSVAPVAIGSIVAWIGFVALLVGLIALGVYLATRHLYGWLQGSERGPIRAQGNDSVGTTDHQPR